ncbi:MAG: dCTP deaminase [Pseudomonadota bacterium]
MPIKSDRWIRRMALEHKMIEPFAPEQVRDGKISFGTSSYGYDLRVANEFQIFRGKNPIDPKKSDETAFESFKGSVCEIPPNSFVLAKSVEYFRIPRDILTICFGKSTYARCGIVVNVTPFEPEWEGFVTMAISNTSPVPVRIYANEGIAQVVFLKADEVCETSYADKKGKYQAQKTITAAKV